MNPATLAAPRYVVTIEPTPDDARFSVVLADGLYPGVTVAHLDTAEEADGVTVQLAMFHRCPAVVIGDGR